MELWVESGEGRGWIAKGKLRQRFGLICVISFDLI